MLPDGATRVRDARLTALAALVSTTNPGQTLALPFDGPAGNGTVELVVPSPATLRLTPLGPQGLIAPVPLGWSVLAGFDFQLTVGTFTAPALLRVPYDLVLPGFSVALTAAVWDDSAGVWLGGPAVTLQSAPGGDIIEVEIAGEGQIALLVADAPLVANEGMPLDAGTGDTEITSGLVVPVPDEVVASPSARAQVFSEVVGAMDAPSGAAIEVRLHESHDLGDGSLLLGAVSRQDLAVYRVSVTSVGALGGGTPGALATSFTLGPQLAPSLAEYVGGRIRIEAVTAPSVDSAVLDGAGAVTVGIGADVALTIPSGAASAGTVVTIADIAAADLPAASGAVAAFRLGLARGGLDPAATYHLALDGVPVSNGDAFVIGRAELIGGRAVLRAVAVGSADAGLVAVTSCANFGGSPGCLPGFAASGSYAVIPAPSGLAVAVGTAEDELETPVADLLVESASLAPVAVTDAAGDFVLPIAAGGTTTITASDLARGLAGEREVTAPAQAYPPPIAADLTVSATRPVVLTVDPANHAGGVDPETFTVVRADVSERLDPASLLPGAVQLSLVERVRESAGGEVETAVAGQATLSADRRAVLFTPATPLALNAVYRFRLSAQITDATGAPLLPFESYFTSATHITADALPADTLRVSLPDANDEVVVCGGELLAFPGTVVVVTNVTGQDDTTTCSTGANPDPECIGVVSTCDPLDCAIHSGGSFCAMLEASLGDRIEVIVKDALGREVTIDAGNMTDPATGETAIGPQGGVVTFPEVDGLVPSGYRAFFAAGTFAEQTLVRLRPILVPPEDQADYAKVIAAGALDIDAPAYASFFDPDLLEHVDVIGAVRVELDPPLEEGEKLAQPYDVSVPDLDPVMNPTDHQYLATRQVNFRGQDELTMIDQAHFEEPEDLVVTDPSAFEGLTIGGTFGLHRWKECVGFVSGWSSTGDHMNTGGFLGGGLLGPILPFPINAGERVRWTVPMPCNDPVEVKLFDSGGNVLDTIECPTCNIGANGVTDLPGALSDSASYPEPLEDQPFVPNGQVAVPPWQRIEMRFAESMDPASLPGNVELRICGPSEGPGSDPRTQDCDAGPSVDGHPELTLDGRVLVFVPDVRLRYGLRYRLRIRALTDRNGQPMLRPIYHWFSTNLPTVAAHIPGDIRDVAVVANVPGSAPGQRFLAVVEGDAYKADLVGGVRLYEVTDPTTLQAPRDEYATAGVDRAVTATASGPLDTTGPDFAAPFIISVDGPGGVDRYGAWRITQVANVGGTPKVVPINTRLVNLSRNALDRLNGVDDIFLPPTGFTDLSHLAGVVPIDLGVPLDVATFGVARSYLANSPFIGLQSIDLTELDVGLDNVQVHGTFRDTSNAHEDVPIRAVSILSKNDEDEENQDRVLAIAQERSDNVLLLTDLGLELNDKYTLPARGRPLAVLGLNDWPTRVDPVGPDGLVYAEIQERDLAVVMCEGLVCVVPIDAASGEFLPGLIRGGVGMLTTPGGPRAAPPAIRRARHSTSPTAPPGSRSWISSARAARSTPSVRTAASASTASTIVCSAPWRYPIRGRPIPRPLRRSPGPGKSSSTTTSTSAPIGPWRRVCRASIWSRSRCRSACTSGR